MKTFTIETTDSDSTGEFLRGQFFVQFKDGEWIATGCYGTFDTQSDAIRNEDEIVEHDPDFVWTVFKKTIQGEEIKMRYYWDGDGILEFSGKGWKLVNFDCKKDHYWEWVE